MEDRAHKDPSTFFRRDRQAEAHRAPRGLSKAINAAPTRQMSCHRSKDVPPVKGLAHRMEKIRFRSDLHYPADVTRGEQIAQDPVVGRNVVPMPALGHETLAHASHA